MLPSRLVEFRNASPRERLAMLHPNRWTLRARLLVALWAMALLPTLTVIGLQNWFFGGIVEDISGATVRLTDKQLADSKGLEFSMRKGPVVLRYQSRPEDPAEATAAQTDRRSAAHASMRKLYRGMMQTAQAASTAMGFSVMFVAVLVATLFALWISRCIARPIEDERAVREAELSRVSQELEIAARIQAAMLPTDVAAQNFELSLAQRPATEVGGDLLDYLPQADCTFWLAVGDVTGHGLSPGLISMMAQSILVGLVTRAPDATPTELLTSLNEALHRQVKERLKDDNYMSLQLIRHLGEGRFVAAGLHADILVYRAAHQSVERIEVPGMWTGLLPDISDMTQDVHFQLGQGDLLLLYSDGLVEAKNAQGEQYDMARLEAALARHAGLPADELKARVLAEVTAWLDVQTDDISILVMRSMCVASALRSCALEETHAG